MSLRPDDDTSDRAYTRISFFSVSTITVTVPGGSSLVATFTAGAGVGVGILDLPAGTNLFGGAGVTGERRMLIDGQLVDAEGGRTFDNVNPATEDVVGTSPDATVGDTRSTRPASGCSAATSIRARVDFPLPDSPTTPTASPGRTTRSTPSRAATEPPPGSR